MPAVDAARAVSGRRGEAATVAMPATDGERAVAGRVAALARPPPHTGIMGLAAAELTPKLKRRFAAGDETASLWLGRTAAVAESEDPAFLGVTGPPAGNAATWCNVGVAAAAAASVASCWASFVGAATSTARTAAPAGVTPPGVSGGRCSRLEEPPLLPPPLRARVLDGVALDAGTVASAGAPNTTTSGGGFLEVAVTECSQGLIDAGTVTEGVGPGVRVAVGVAAGTVLRGDGTGRPQAGLDFTAEGATTATPTGVAATAAAVTAPDLIGMVGTAAATGSGMEAAGGAATAATDDTRCCFAPPADEAAALTGFRAPLTSVGGAAGSAAGRFLKAIRIAVAGEAAATALMAGAGDAAGAALGAAGAAGVAALAAAVGCVAEEEEGLRTAAAPPPDACLAREAVGAAAFPPSRPAAGVTLPGAGALPAAGAGAIGAVLLRSALPVPPPLVVRCASAGGAGWHGSGPRPGDSLARSAYKSQGNVQGWDLIGASCSHAAALRMPISDGPKG